MSEEVLCSRRAAGGRPSRRLQAFFDEHVLPAEHALEAEIEANRRAGNVWQPLRVVEELKPKAKAAGLWNLCMPHKSERFPNALW